MLDLILFYRLYIENNKLLCVLHRNIATKFSDKIDH